MFYADWSPCKIAAHRYLSENTAPRSADLRKQPSNFRWGVPVFMLNQSLGCRSSQAFPRAPRWPCDTVHEVQTYRLLSLWVLTSAIWWNHKNCYHSKMVSIILTNDEVLVMSHPWIGQPCGSRLWYQKRPPHRAPPLSDNPTLSKESNATQSKCSRPWLRKAQKSPLLES